MVGVDVAGEGGRGGSAMVVALALVDLWSGREVAKPMAGSVSVEGGGGARNEATNLRRGANPGEVRGGCGGVVRRGAGGWMGGAGGMQKQFGGLGGSSVI